MIGFCLIFVAMFCFCTHQIINKVQPSILNLVLVAVISLGLVIGTILIIK